MKLPVCSAHGYPTITTRAFHRDNSQGSRRVSLHWRHLIWVSSESHLISSHGWRIEAILDVVWRSQSGRQHRSKKQILTAPQPKRATTSISGPVGASQFSQSKIGIMDHHMKEKRNTVSAAQGSAQYVCRHDAWPFEMGLSPVAGPMLSLCSPLYYHYHYGLRATAADRSGPPTDHEQAPTD